MRLSLCLLAVLCPLCSLPLGRNQRENVNGQSGSASAETQREKVRYLLFVATTVCIARYRE